MEGLPRVPASLLLDSICLPPAEGAGACSGKQSFQAVFSQGGCGLSTWLVQRAHATEKGEGGAGDAPSPRGEPQAWPACMVLLEWRGPEKEVRSRGAVDAKGPWQMDEGC